MKLLCVSPSYWPAFQYGGPILSVHGLNRALAELGADVTVYTTNAGTDASVRNDQPLFVENVQVTYFTCNGVVSTVFPSWTYSKSLITALKESVRKFDLVYIVGIWNHQTLIASKLSNQEHVPYVISPRGHLYEETAENKIWKKNPYYHLFLKKYVQDASAIHYTSEDEAHKTHSRLGLKNPFLVVPNAIESSQILDRNKRELFLKYPHLEGKTIFLFLGRINWKKGLELLIESYSKLVRRHGDIHLLIAGNDGDGYADKVKNWADEKRLSWLDLPSLSAVGDSAHAKITFTGFLNEDLKRIVLSGSDVFVLPSYSENFGMAVLEAMAAGLPVVVTDAVGLSTFVKEYDAGIVISPQADGLFHAMDTLIIDKRMAVRMGDNGKRLVLQKFLWKRVASQMFTELENLINR